MIGHINYLVAVDVDAHGGFEVGPLIQEPAVGAEHLYPVILPVGNVYSPVFRHPNAMRYPELARPTARRAEGVYGFPIGGEPVDAGITISVRDINLSRRSNRCIGRMVERGLHRRFVPCS